MLAHPVHPIRRLAVGVGLLTAVVLAQAATTTSTIPLAPHGDGLYGPASEPIALTPSAFVVAVQGPDGDGTTIDDVTLLVTGVGGTPVVTALPTPFTSDYSGAPARLSATRVVLIGAGPNGDFAQSEGAGSGDSEVLYLLDRLGSGNVVTAIPVGNVQDSGANAPQRLTAGSAVLSTFGPDNERNTADDTVAVVSDLGRTNTVTHLPAPYTRDSTGRPTVLSPTSFLISSRGPDRDAETADDVTYLFTDVGGANTRTTLATPFHYRYRPGRAVRVNADRAVMCGEGPDEKSMTGDDELIILDGLSGATPTVTRLAVGAIQRYGAGEPTPLTEDLLVIAGAGPDGDRTSDDDEIIIVSGLGTTNTIARVTVGHLADDGGAHPVRLSPTSCAFSSAGPDNEWEEGANGMDDEVVILTDVGGANTITRVPVPGMVEYSTSEVVALSPNALLVTAGGPDGDVGYGIDVLNVVTRSGTDWTVEPITLSGTVGEYGRSFQPHLLGRTRAVLLTGGPDDDPEDGGDDDVQVFDNLPADPANSLFVKKLLFKFKVNKPEKPTVVTVTGTVLAQGLDYSNDLTFTLGNCSQTIPGSAFTVNKKGILRYKDKKRVNGFISLVQWKPKNGKLTIKGKGVGIGAETTNAAYIPLAIEGNWVDLCTSVQGKTYGKGIKYKAPK